MKRLSVDEFKVTFSQSEPSEELTLHERALWFAGKGDWKSAHQIVQDMNDKFSSRIHAFLHRQEGDISNARYWYNKAGENLPALSIYEEWEKLFKERYSL